MNSGETAKPPATFEERNPFDISKRSEKEVAAEIAQRMAAWKQARGRSYATQSSTVPAPEPKPLGAPIQPARLPKFGEYARAHPTADTAQSRPDAPPVLPANASSANRAAFESRRAGFAGDEPAPTGARPLSSAPLAAIQRAMPPAPSLKRAAVHLERAAPRMAAPSPAQWEAPRLESGRLPDAWPRDLAPQTGEMAAIQVVVPHRPEEALAIASVPISEVRANEIEVPAMGAFDIATEDIDVQVAPKLPPDHVTEIETHPVEAGAIDARDATEPAVAEDIVTQAAPTFETTDAQAHAIETRGADKLTLVERAAEFAAQFEPLETEPQTTEERGVDMPTPAALEIELAAPAQPQAEAPERQMELRAIKALDTEVSTRHEAEAATVSDLMLETAEIEIHRSDAVQMRDADQPPPETRDLEAPPVSQIEARAMVADRHELEPNLDTAERSDADTLMPRKRVADPNSLSLDAANLAVRRIEFPGMKLLDIDAPVVARKAERTTPTDLALEIADIAAHRIGMGDAVPSVEATKVEAPHSEILAPEPRIEARRPIFPHIEPAEWEIRPPVASMHPRRQARGGTGWAIGLGSLLLIAGVTAPAAIWQRGSTLAPSSLDQAVTIDPAPTAVAQTSSPTEGAQTNLQAASPQTAAAQPAAPSSVSPTVQAQNQPLPQPESNATAADTQQPEPQPAAPQPAAQQASQQTTLGTVADGGEVAAAPISVPPPPQAIAPELAPQPMNRSSAPAMAATPLFPPASHPFQPEFSAAPFHPAPAAAVKPNMAGRLKPTQSASIAVPTSPSAASVTPQRVVAKPAKLVTQKKRPVLDQMFDDLIQSLSGSQPVNPANKPPAPSQRR